MPASVTIEIPKPVGGALTPTIEAGRELFVLGANGTGKSSLMFLLHKTFQTRATRISAHRQLWFQFEASLMSGGEFEQARRNTASTDSFPNSRFQDGHHHSRPMLTLFALARHESDRDRKIATAVDDRRLDDARQIAQDTESLVRTMNELIREANIQVQVGFTSNQKLEANRSGTASYNAARLSDGERSAILMIADVLTAPSGTLLLIDEPERHMHRSIISPLLTSIFKARTDCMFVVATHDIELPLQSMSASVLLLRSVEFRQDDESRWDADLITLQQLGEAEDVKKDILGGRRRMVFVEGEEQSLDFSIYSLIFPGVTVIPKGSCVDVTHAVSSIRGARSLVWLQAYGIIDGDGRLADEVTALRGKGIYALCCSSVESIYYDRLAQQRVTERQVEIVGGEVDALIEAARVAGLAATHRERVNLCARRVHHLVRSKLMEQQPSLDEIKSATTAMTVSVDVAGELRTEMTVFDRLHGDGDLSAIIRRYPVRYSSALANMASALGFGGKAKYERAVRRLLAFDTTLLTTVRSYFGDLIADVNQSDCALTVHS